jgi:outer membrane receptor protein involved in Fe transport
MNLFRLRARLGAVAAMLLAIATGASAQTTGSIGGRVVDGAGNPIEGAQIQVANRGTGATRGVASNAAGRYLVVGLEPGSGYVVTVRRIGYTPVTRENQAVTLGQITRVDVSLTQQATTLGQVTISAEIDPVITASKTGVGTTIGDSAMRRLPTLNRNFTDFMALTPQVSTSGPGMSGGGTNNRYNNIQIDGANESDLFGLGSTGQPGGQAGGKSIGIEAVKQYQVLVSPYDVSYGNFAGALVNAITKSGTNEYSGSAYWYFRDQQMERKASYVTKFKQTQTGFTLGGPIIKDRIHFFTNFEVQGQQNPASGPYLGGPFTNVPAAADISRLSAIAQSYNLPATGAGQRWNENPLTNSLVRLDIQKLPFNSTLTLRNNYGHAEQDVFSRSSTSSTFKMEENGYRFKSDKNAWVMQVRSAFNGGMYNEFSYGYTRIRDKRALFVGGTPQYVVRTVSGISMQAGSENSSQLNELDQDIWELNDQLTIPIGTSHRISLGTQNSWYKVRNAFGQNIFGNWTFNSLDDFQNGIASAYSVSTPANADGQVHFRARLNSAFIQDAWQATNRLAITAGVRADVNYFLDKPPANPLVTQYYNRNTDEINSGNLVVSPRIGFNWDVTGDGRNQLRGGVGYFTGRPAYVWMSNSFQNNGVTGFLSLTCSSLTTAPRFNAASIATPPLACASGSTPAPISQTGEIDLINKDVKFPTSGRASLGYDRAIGSGWVATIEGMYTKTMDSWYYTNIALTGLQGYDRHGRAMYGTAPVSAVLRGPRQVVLEVTNQSKDYAYSLTGGLTRKFRNNFEGSANYTYSVAKSVQDLTSSTAGSQYRFGQPRGAVPQEDVSKQPLGNSVFSQPHKIAAWVSYTLPKSGTTITTSYTGVSGQAFHYVYSTSSSNSSGDMNADGQFNDLMYIPKNVRDSNEVIFVATSLATVAQQQDAFEAFMKKHSCLWDNRGKIMQRGDCREPFKNFINVSLRQNLGRTGLANALRAPAMNNLSLQWDIFNFANFINKKWGAQDFTGFGSVDAPLVYNSKETGSMIGPTGARPKFTFNPAFSYTNRQNFSSLYQMQFSVKYSF